MDAFEKLAKLAGASVESVGEGLPRTRKEALAIGVKRYFTGKPCPYGHVAERIVSSGACHECHLKRLSQRAATPEYKERRRKRNAMPECREYHRRYDAAPERIERRCQSNIAKTGDPGLFAVNQAERAARLGCVANIVSQCPEPQRSQLQALVDRIKADPQAGKAVVGLLRTMRELRKAELAEMKAGLDAG